MELNHREQQLRECVEQVIDNGCHYRLDRLAELYSTDLKVVLLAPDGHVMAMNFDEVMQMFQAKKDNGEPPLDRSAVFNYVEADGDRGHVVVTRQVALMGTPQEVVFNLTLARAAGGWKVVREFAVVTGSG